MGLAKGWEDEEEGDGDEDVVLGDKGDYVFDHGGLGGDVRGGKEVRGL